MSQQTQIAPKELDASAGPPDIEELELQKKEAQQPVDFNMEQIAYPKVQPDTQTGEGFATAGRPASGTKREGQNDEVTDFHNVIEKKISEYNPDEKVDSKSEYTITEKMSFMEIVKLYADGQDKCMMTVGLIGSLLFAIAQPLFAFMFGHLLDGVGGRDGMDAMKMNTYIMLGIGVFVGLAVMLQTSLWSMFSQRLQHKIKIRYFQNCLQKDAKFYDSQNPSEMASKISKETASIQRGFGEKIAQVIFAFMAFVFGFTFAFIWAWQFTFILFAGFPILMMVMVGFAKGMDKGVLDSMRGYAQSAGYAEQAIYAIKVVHTYGQELLEEKNYMKYLQRSSKIQAKISCKQALGLSCGFGIMFLFYAYCFYWGGYLKFTDAKVNGQIYTGGKIITTIFCVIIGSFNLAGCLGYYLAVAEAQVASYLIHQTIDHKPDVNSDEPGTFALKQGELQGHVEFKDVTFKYPSRDDLTVLDNFSCVFEAGKTTALVGPSGCGKSTIIQLVERFYNTLGGQVLIDGRDIKSLNLKSLRQQMGYVGQEPVLFNTTIKENMLFAKPDATDQEIEEALKSANAWEFVKKRSDGIDTHIGGSLSGGQKQRIAIARAFIKRPKILLLDEATSALDKGNEGIVQEAIDSYRKKVGNMTIIVIAHRLSTIKDADKIVVLRSGKLIEMGSHQEIMTQHPQGTYATFWAKQQSAEAEAEGEEPIELDEEVLEQELQKIGDMSLNKKNTSMNKSSRVEPQDLAMMEQIKEEDTRKDAEMKKWNEEQKKKSGFNKLLKYNRPCFLIVTAVLASCVTGAMQPVFSIFFSKLLGIMTLPLEMIEADTRAEKLAWIEEEITWYCSIMCLVSLGSFVGPFTQRLSFGLLGTNVTLSIREVLYTSILQKHIGWFDHPDNATGVLTSAMASDTSIINGASTEALGPQFEGMCSIAAGLTIGFYFCWQMALVMFAIAPFFMLSSALGKKFSKGFALETNELTGTADRLCSDAIVNYKTVQSLGHEEMIVQRYKSILDPVNQIAVWHNFKQGATMGFSQFVTYCAMATMFFFAAVFIEGSCDQETQKCSINPADVFMALFAIMFGASHAGTAQAFGPDIGKAHGAADRIFTIVEHPSDINAVEIEKEAKHKKIDFETFQGKIELKNVWFRYPTRREDFVLRGLSLVINPNESVALVGESGCGKSTVVNLLMRFYDVDFGEVLLDGINIQEYDLHDLRTVISLVMQEPIIFNYSILENVLYGKSNATNEEVLDATQISNALEFIESKRITYDETAESLMKEMETQKNVIIEMIGADKFKEEMEVLAKMKVLEDQKGTFKVVEGDVDYRPDSLKSLTLDSGFGSTCGTKGGNLSGGQKQRLAIARTIIRKPKILLLDEATSALDEDSQKVVQEALDKASKGRTTITIAHRMSTIENCDKIFVLEQGKVNSSGGFQQLKQGGGLFSKLARNRAK